MWSCYVHTGTQPKLWLRARSDSNLGPRRWKTRKVSQRQLIHTSSHLKVSFIAHFIKLFNEVNETSTDNTTNNNSPTGTNDQQQTASERSRAPPLGVFGEENSFEIELAEMKPYDRFLSKARAVKSKKGIWTTLVLNISCWLCYIFFSLPKTISKFIYIFILYIRATVSYIKPCDFITGTNVTMSCLSQTRRESDNQHNHNSFWLNFCSFWASSF